MTDTQSHPTPRFVAVESTGLYLRQDEYEGQWISSVEYASTFATVTEAFAAAESAGATDFHAVNIAH